MTEERIYQELLRRRDTLLRGNPLETKAVVQAFVEEVMVSADTIQVEYVFKAAELPDDCASKWWRKNI